MLPIHVRPSLISAPAMLDLRTEWSRKGSRGARGAPPRPVEGHTRELGGGGERRGGACEGSDDVESG